MTSFGPTSFKFSCSNCSRPVEQSYSWLASHDQYACYCGKLIDIEILRMKVEFDYLLNRKAQTEVFEI